jgi:hypothetical protein
MASPQPRPFEYDVFISYTHHDAATSWVRDVLTPALKREGFSLLIDVESFRLGAATVDEMERGVVKSRYTLAILTPEYLRSNFTNIENVMAETLGLEQSELRLASVMRIPCDPGLRIRSRLWLDMTDDSQFESNMTRLVGALRRPPGVER